MRCSYLVYMGCAVWIYCNLWNESMNFYMRMISGVVCHSNNDECWSDSVMKCSCSGICDVIWSDSCVSYCKCDFDICKSVIVILICYFDTFPGDSA